MRRGSSTSHTSFSCRRVVSHKFLRGLASPSSLIVSRLGSVCVVWQETKFREAIRYYEPIVKKHSENILDVTAIVLANICVAYIMTSQNEEAEELMRKIEREEERVRCLLFGLCGRRWCSCNNALFSANQRASEDPDKQYFHLCIVNLVIGTLYCAKVVVESCLLPFFLPRLRPLVVRSRCVCDRLSVPPG
jgi:hypothetical protein